MWNKTYSNNRKQKRQKRQDALYKAFREKHGYDYPNQRGSRYLYEIGDMYKRLKAGAKSRGLIVELTIDDCFALIQKPCAYCGLECRGIDRIDNGQGYTKENSIGCCAYCNLMKNKYTKEEFLEHVRRIYQHNFSLQTKLLASKGSTG